MVYLKSQNRFSVSEILYIKVWMLCREIILGKCHCPTLENERSILLYKDGKAHGANNLWACMLVGLDEGHSLARALFSSIML